MPHLAVGLRQSLLLARDADAATEPAAAGVLIVTSRLEPVSVSAPADSWLSELDEWPCAGVRSLAIVSVVSRLLAIERMREHVSPISLPLVRVQARTGRWLTLSASRLPSASNEDHIAVVVEPTRSEQIVPLLLGAYALTDREERVARLAVEGASNKEIARALTITPLTAQQHLKSVFEKTHVHSRGELRARLQIQGVRIER